MRPLSIAIFLAATVSASSAQNPLELLVQQQSHYWFTVESVPDPEFLEAADDFDLVADIHRVRAQGHACWSCVPGDLLSARLAFYAWTSEGPGALQAEYVFQDGDPGLGYSEGPGLIDFVLPEPFAATGPHFLSVQVELVGFWSWWASNYGEPVGAPVYSRSTPDGEWSRHEIIYPAGPANADLGFEIYGTDDTPPTAGTDPCGPWSVVATPSPEDGFGVFLRDVSAVAADDVWAVGGYTNLYAPPFGIQSLSWIQHWDGAQWSFVPSPNPEPYTNGANLTLYAVEAVAADDVWAAGSYRVQNPSGGSLGSQIFVVHWDGSSWSHVPAPMSASGSGPHVKDIRAFGPDDVWFLGQWLGFELSALGEQRSLALHWDGSSFEIVETPFFDNSGGYGGGHAIEAADGIAPDDVWAVGGAHNSDFSPHSYIIHWDGNEWTHVPGPTPGFYNRLFAVAAVGPDDVWASGAYSAEGGGYVPLYLHWDGSSWTQVEAPGGGNALLARPESGDVISTAGIYGGQGVFRWDGSSWTSVMDFGTSTNPSVVALSRVPGSTCDIWGVGRQNGPDAGGLTVSLEGSETLASVMVLEPCTGLAPPQSLVASPAPKLGKHVSVAVGDPTSSATVAPGSPVALAYGGPAGECGAPLAGYGPDLQLGELFLQNAIGLVGVEVWSGPEDPAVFDLVVPDEASLLGLQASLQAVFVDAFDGDVVLTRGVSFTFGL